MQSTHPPHQGFVSPGVSNYGNFQPTERRSEGLQPFLPPTMNGNPASRKSNNETQSYKGFRIRKSATSPGGKSSWTNATSEALAYEEAILVEIIQSQQSKADIDKQYQALKSRGKKEAVDELVNQTRHNANASKEDWVLACIKDVKGLIKGRRRDQETKEIQVIFKNRRKLAGASEKQKVQNPQTGPVSKNNHVGSPTSPGAFGHSPNQKNAFGQQPGYGSSPLDYFMQTPQPSPPYSPTNLPHPPIMRPQNHGLTPTNTNQSTSQHPNMHPYSPQDQSNYSTVNGPSAYNTHSSPVTPLYPNRHFDQNANAKAPLAPDTRKHRPAPINVGRDNFPMDHQKPGQNHKLDQHFEPNAHVRGAPNRSRHGKFNPSFDSSEASDGDSSSIFSNPAIVPSVVSGTSNSDYSGMVNSPTGYDDCSAPIGKPPREMNRPSMQPKNRHPDFPDEFNNNSPGPFNPPHMNQNGFPPNIPGPPWEQTETEFDIRARYDRECERLKQNLNRDLENLRIREEKDLKGTRRGPEKVKSWNQPQVPIQVKPERWSR